MNQEKKPGLVTVLRCVGLLVLLVKFLFLAWDW